jgi:hypothetical protein
LSDSTAPLHKHHHAGKPPLKAASLDNTLSSDV